MQIACYELYEEEKKRNEGKTVDELYYQVYKLSKRRNSFSNLKYTNFVFANNEDNIIAYLHYQTFDKTASGGYGKVEYDFYLVKNNGKYYLQYFNLENLYNVASSCGKNAISNLSRCDEVIVGINTTKYKKYVIKNAMSNKIPICDTELSAIFKDIKQIDFSSLSSYSDYFDYSYATTRIEILDFENKNTFYTDEYVLPKFLPYIQFIEFVFKTCQITNLEKCNLKYIDNFKEAREILVEKTLKSKYYIY